MTAGALRERVDTGIREGDVLARGFLLQRVDGGVLLRVLLVVGDLFGERFLAHSDVVLHLIYTQPVIC